MKLVVVGGGSTYTPELIGTETAAAGLAEVVENVRVNAGLGALVGVMAEQVTDYLANADLTAEVAVLKAALVRRGWGGATEVYNDTFGLLRAGLDEPRGVAVVCGAGINWSDMLPDGRTVRFAAVGDISGDWGGGELLLQEAMWWAGTGRGQARRRHGAAYRAAPAPGAGFDDRFDRSGAPRSARRADVYELEPRAVRGGRVWRRHCRKDRRPSGRGSCGLGVGGPDPPWS